MLFFNQDILFLNKIPLYLNTSNVILQLDGKPVITIKYKNLNTSNVILQ